MSKAPRDLLLSIYHQTLHAVHGHYQVASYLKNHYPYSHPLALVASGKAASEMAWGAFEVLGSQITHALIVTKKDHLKNVLPNIYFMISLETAHPVPDASSLAAGQTLLDFVASLPPRYPILFLISGGTSALIEVLAPEVTLMDLQKTNQWLLACGLDIHAMNQVRKNLSAIKGGRLANYIVEHPTLVLLISDVPGDDLHAIGSGLLTYHEHIPLPPNLPKWLHALTSHALPLANPACFAHITQRIIASPATARQAAVKIAREHGYVAYSYENLIVGDALQAGRALGKQLCTIPPGIHVWSSETTVRLPEHPGQGGRCQSLALAAACELAEHQGIYLLAAGSDGNDGMEYIAGALVDGGTLQRGQGIDAQTCLSQAHAGYFLSQSGDLIQGISTGTNVMDILIGFKH